MDLAKEKHEEIVMTEDPNKIVQMPIRIDAKTRDELKIFAIKKGKTLNEILLKYVKEGFKKDKSLDKE
jgi:hypothetical protein